MVLKNSIRVFLFAVIAMSSLNVHAQGIKIGVISNEITISGRVLDATDQTPIPGVNVYLNNTTVGGTTNKDGYYKFTTTLTGTYNIIFSFIGYKKQAFAAQLGKNGSKTVNINTQLEQSVYSAGEITVTGDNRKWRRNFTAFSRNFLGESDFAELTGIENYTDVEFNDENRSKFTASSKGPLTIINRALGYKIIVDLEEFEWNLRKETGYYYTYQRFEELEPQNEAEEKIWKENRKKAYRGSLRHFLHSIYYKKSYNEGFTFRQAQSLKEITGPDLSFLENRGRISNTDDFKFYYLTREIRVTYNTDTNELLTSRRIAESNLTPLRANDIIGFDKNGNLYDPLSVKIAGYWSFSRIANQLPFDYNYQ